MSAFESYIARRWIDDPLKQGNAHPVPFKIVAALGLAGECGEVMELLKKHWRDGKHPGKDIALELGDLLHYLIVIAQAYGLTLDDLARENIRKLDARDKAKGVSLYEQA